MPRPEDTLSLWGCVHLGAGGNATIGLNCLVPPSVAPRRYDQDDVNVKGSVTFSVELLRTTSGILASAEGLGVDKLNQEFKSTREHAAAASPAAVCTGSG